MAQTLTQCLIHFIFSTKNREPLITAEIEPSLFAYINGIARNHKSVIIAINGTTDHIHILLSMSKTLSMSDCMENIKGDSSRWIKTQGPEFANFHWQDGYAGFSVSTVAPSRMEWLFGSRPLAPASSSPVPAEFAPASCAKNEVQPVPTRRAERRQPWILLPSSETTPLLHPMPPGDLMVHGIGNAEKSAPKPALSVIKTP